MWKKFTQGILTNRRSFALLTLESLNPKVIQAEYAVRGIVVTKATELEKRLVRGEHLKCKEIIPCNIGNPQSLGQKPLTWVRQV